MRMIGGILDRLVLVAGFVAGGCIPGFIAQYRQRVGGALDQVLKDLAPFQAIADRLHGGSLEALVQHHLASTDATFHAEGAAIRAMMDSLSSLREAFRSLETDLFRQIAYLLQHADGAMLRATWRIFEPTFVLSPDCLLVAALVGISIWLVFLGVWWSGVAFFRPKRFSEYN
jgi:hypothetical protein